MTPYASPPRPPFVPMRESPPRPPCIVVTRFDEKSGDGYIAAIPAPSPRARPFSTDAARDVLERVTTRIDFSRSDQTPRVLIAARAAVPIRRPAVSTESPGAAGYAVGRVREYLTGSDGIRHFDGDCRASVSASATGRRRGAPAARSPVSARHGRDHVPLDHRVRRAGDDNARGGTAVAATTSRASRASLTVAPTSSAHAVDGVARDRGRRRPRHVDADANRAIPPRGARTDPGGSCGAADSLNRVSVNRCGRPAGHEDPHREAAAHVRDPVARDGREAGLLDLDSDRGVVDRVAGNLDA